MFQKKLVWKKMVDVGLITQEQLNQAVKESQKTKKPLMTVLVDMGLMPEEELAAFFSEQTGIPQMNLSDYLISEDVLNIIPEDMAKRYEVMPVFKVGSILTLAMTNPTDVLTIDELKSKTGCEIDPVIATRTAIKNTIDQYYGVRGSMDEAIKSIDTKDLDLKGEEQDISKLADVVEEAPLIKLVNLIIMEAVQEQASDIHIEPEKDRLRIRYRVDGILHEVKSPPKVLQSAIVSRIKVLSEMDISETRAPQDGRFQLRVHNKEIDLRVSTYPTIHGENVVMRLLDKTSVLLSLGELGFSEGTLKQFEDLIRRPYGIMLVTGPTGSGKTTTLYAALNTINTLEKNIITIEDPVEYQLELIRQSQINPKAGLTFASGLRSILRQDPDVIMVGEIRDMETAELAIQAALTGHLVLSTLHTNDAAGAVARLIDMGIEPFLAASSLIGVLAQRLVRIICPQCKQSYEASPALMKQLGWSAEKKPVVLYRSPGCDDCRKTGYRGRIGTFELIKVDDAIKELIVAKVPSLELKEKAILEGMRTLKQDGLIKARSGQTSVEEVLRVTQED